MFPLASTIHTLRAFGPDRLALELQLGQALLSTELHPLGLPPSAILCVRKLRSGMPRTQQWSQGLQVQLGALASRAVRPLLTPVPANAEAVLFIDRAEMMTCLAVDWVGGASLQRWWWKGLLSQSQLGQPEQIWVKSPQMLPTVLHHLNQQNLAVAFVKRLETTSVQPMLENLLRCYGLVKLMEVLGQSQAPVAMDGVSPEFTFLPDPNKTQSPRSRWQGFAPDEAKTLPKSTQLLLNIGLGLYQAPAVVRSSSFATEVAQWLKHPDIASTREQTSSAVKASVSIPKTTLADQRKAPQAQPPNAVAQAQARAKTTEPFTASLMPDTTLQGSASALVPSTPEAKPPIQPSSLPRTQPHLKFQPLTVPISTAYGGVFYLLNLALHLDLYADFSSPLKQGLELSPWEWLALIAQEWIGPELHTDPLWQLLAQLSQSDIPGAGFNPADSWSVPADWLASFPEAAECTYWAQRGYLQVWHPEGFCIWAGRSSLDQVREAYARQAWSYVEARKPKVEGQKIRSKGHRSSGLKRWLGWLVPYLEARLFKALSIPANQVGLFVCAQPAQVFLGDDLEIIFNLQTHPIQLRLAGLDRDPGWIPAIGKRIRFGFE